MLKELDSWIGKDIVVTLKNYREISGKLFKVDEYCHDSNDIEYTLNFVGKLAAKVLKSEIICIRENVGSANDKKVIPHIPRSYEECKAKFDKFYDYIHDSPANPKKYLSCGTQILTDSFGNSVRLECTKSNTLSLKDYPTNHHISHTITKKETMKVKVQVIIEAAEKALEKAKTEYKTKLSENLSKYKQEYAIFIEVAESWDGLDNLVAPSFYSPKNPIPQIERDLRILNALAEPEAEVNSDNNCVAHDSLTQLFRKYVVRQDA